MDTTKLRRMLEALEYCEANPEQGPFQLHDVIDPPALIEALREQLGPAQPVPATWCPQCGEGVDVDEDGCCSSCGATATGEGADQALAALRAARPQPVEVEEVSSPRELDADDLAQAVTDWLTKKGDATVPAPGENATAIIQVNVHDGAFESLRVVGYVRPTPPAPASAPADDDVGLCHLHGYTCIHRPFHKGPCIPKITITDGHPNACKICEAAPNAAGEIHHGKGCYAVSEDGGGVSSVGDGGAS